MEEKILILTLGTGRNQNLGKEFDANAMTEEEKQTKLRYIFESDTFAYQRATYVLTDEDGTEILSEESEFVAKPLITAEKPDRIFIIGTVRSAWSSFYSKFAGKPTEGNGGRNYDNYRKLYDIESGSEYGVETCADELEPIARTIEEIFRQDRVFADIVDRTMDVHILLTRYGINRQQLEENYRIISGMTAEFQEKVKYHISFDITHSFRSLPLYNLIVLNYVQHITQYQVEIDHVYYGNIDVRNETNNKAYIVDLKDLIHVLELTNGVGEFRDTGNCVALLGELEEDKTGLKEVLQAFDWATQMNDYQAIVNSLTEILSIVENSTGTSPYADLNEMLNRVLSEDFISSEQLLHLKNIESHPAYVGELQVRITKWYQKQNRYGLAIATGMEALRSLLVPLWLENRYPDKTESECVTLEACRNENNRKGAEAMLETLRQNVEGGLINDHSDAMRLLTELAQVKNEAKKIRNRFAHNLSPEQTGGSRSLKTSYEEEKEVIDKYIQYLDELCGALKTEKKKTGIRRAYYSRPVTTKQKTGGAGIRLIIGREANYRDWQKYKKSIKKSYDVYVLPDNLSGAVVRTKAKKYNNVIEDAFLLAYYIDNIFDIDDITVILQEDLNFLQKVCFPPVLKFFGVKTVQIDGMSLPDYELKIDDIDELKARTKESYGVKYNALKACKLPVEK